MTPKLFRVLVGLVLVIALAWSFAPGWVAERFFGKDPPVDHRAALPADLTTQLYPVSMRTIDAPFLPGHGGGLEAVGNDLLLLLRTGALHFAREGDSAFRAVDMPPFMDMAAQDAAMFAHKALGVRSFWTQRQDDRLQMIVAHTYLDAGGAAGRACMGLALSRSTADWTDSGPVSIAPWQVIYRTQPCLPVDQNPFPLAGGGAFDVQADGQILISVGDFGLNGVRGPADVLAAQDPDSDYGKILSVNPDSGEAQVVASGVRNSSGLKILADGRAFEVHHGFRGGDELNLIRQGANYGWPLVTYGTEYQTYDWPLNARQGRHEGYDQPVFAWSPSIAVGPLAQARGGVFELWGDDLLLGSLKSMTLHRIVLDGDRVVLVEPIPIGARIRDMAVREDGRVAMMFDSRPFIGILEPIPAADQVADLPDSLKSCTTCHALSATGPSGSAPRLHRIIGQQVGVQTGYDYSPALAAARGQRWDEALLVDYLAGSFAAGSTMPGRGLPRDQAERIARDLAALE